MSGKFFADKIALCVIVIDIAASVRFINLEIYSELYFMLEYFATPYIPSTSLKKAHAAISIAFISEYDIVTS